MRDDKKLVGVTIDVDVYCLLETLCNEFGISKSALFELLILKLGFSRYTNVGLVDVFGISYHSSDFFGKYVSQLDDTVLVDLL